MNKEEILEKSRKDYNDEGMIQAENKGREIGFIVFVIVFLIVALMNLFYGDNNDNYGPFAMFWAFLAAESYPKYKFTKRKSDLFTIILSSIGAILWLINLWLSY